MLAIKEYNREHAVLYARTWANARNSLFYNFTGIGGDCTNFVSQCVLAGSCVMNYTPDFGWYFRSADDRAPAWTGVEYFWKFFTGAPDFRSENGGIGPFGRESIREEIEIGDVVQLGNREGVFYHTLIVTAMRGEELLVSAHSNDVYNRPLSAYDAPMKRFLHIQGVRFEDNDRACFENLITGQAIPRNP